MWIDSLEKKNKNPALHNCTKNKFKTKKELKCKRQNFKTFTRKYKRLYLYLGGRTELLK